MKVLRSTSIILTMFIATVAAGADFDGSMPLICAANVSHDCLPTKRQCEPMKGNAGEPLDVRFDFVKKEARTPNRTAPLPIERVQMNEEQLVLQGTDLKFAWSAIIDRSTGAMTVSLADRKGAYIIFGSCKVAPTP